VQIPTSIVIILLNSFIVLPPGMFHANDWPDFDAAAMPYLPVQESHWSSTISLRCGDASARSGNKKSRSLLLSSCSYPLQSSFH
jgi:hypothetical protein